MSESFAGYTGGDLGGGSWSDFGGSGGALSTGGDLGSYDSTALSGYDSLGSSSDPNWFERNQDLITGGVNAGLGAYNAMRPGTSPQQAALGQYRSAISPFMDTTSNLNAIIDPQHIDSLLRSLTSTDQGSIGGNLDTLFTKQQEIIPTLGRYQAENQGLMMPVAANLYSWGDQQAVSGMRNQDYINTGTLPPALQAQLDMSTRANQANLLSAYGTSGTGGLSGGMPSSTALASDISGLNQGAFAQKGQMEQMLAQLGLAQSTEGASMMQQSGQIGNLLNQSNLANAGLQANIMQSGAGIQEMKATNIAKALEGYLGLYGGTQKSAQDISLASAGGGGMSNVGGSSGGGGGGSSGGKGGGSDIGGMISEIAPIAMGAMAMFSDARIKQDIQKTDKKYLGFPVYTYKYSWDDKIQEGLLAQDVELIYPDAVGSINGTKYVDYAKLRNMNV